MVLAERRYGDELESGLLPDSPFIFVPGQRGEPLLALNGGPELETVFLLPSSGEMSVARKFETLSAPGYSLERVATLENGQQTGAGNQRPASGWAKLGEPRTQISTRYRATTALARLLASPELTQTAKALSVQPEEGWLELRGRKVPVAAILRLLVRLCQETVDENAPRPAAAGEYELFGALPDRETEDLICELLELEPPRVAALSREAADEYSSENEFERAPAGMDRSGPDYIRWTQGALNTADHAGLIVDGRTGPATRTAIAHFQHGHGLTADGIVGPNTEQAISSASGIPSPATSRPKVSRDFYARWSDNDDRRKGRRPRDQVLNGRAQVSGMVSNNTAARGFGGAVFLLFNFKIDGAALREEHRTYLSNLAQWMASYETGESAKAGATGGWTAFIEAHASRTGTARHNDDLSEDRYLATRAFLETELLRRGFQVDHRLQISGEGTGFRHSPAAEDIRARAVYVVLQRYPRGNIAQVHDHVTDCKAIPRNDYRSPYHWYQVLNHRVPDGIAVGPSKLMVGRRSVRSLRERNSRVVPVEQGQSCQVNLDLYELEIQVPPPSLFGSRAPMTELELFRWIRLRFRFVYGSEDYNPPSGDLGRGPTDLAVRPAARRRINI